MKREDNHAVQNANGWADTIRALVAAMNVDYDRLEELQDMAGDDMSPEEVEELREIVEAASVDGEIFENADEVRERIQEAPLSVEVRSGWTSIGAKMQAEEFCILLSTGGPALRIVGELDEHMQPTRAWLEYQDWGTPWTHHYVQGLTDALVEFCQCFYFGE